MDYEELKSKIDLNSIEVKEDKNYVIDSEGNAIAYVSPLESKMIEKSI